MSSRPSFEELAEARLAYEQATDPEIRAARLTELEALRSRLGTATRGGLAELTDAQLARRIATLRSEIERASVGRISGTYAQGTSMGQGGGGGLHPVELLEHNARIDRQTGRPALIEELAVLRAERSRRATPDVRKKPALALVLAVVVALAGFAGWLILADDDPPPRQPPPVESPLP